MPAYPDGRVFRFCLLWLVVGTGACRRDAPPAPSTRAEPPSSRASALPSDRPSSTALASPAVTQQSPARARSELKLATWNLEWLSARLEAGVVKRRREDYERLARYADRLDADVVAFQEVDGEEAARRVFSPDRYAFHVASEGGVQRTGFAFKRDLAVERHADYRDLDVGGVRVGTDLTVLVGEQRFRLLSIHLKSGCFDDPLTKRGSACEKLAAQLPKLEAWIDARANERIPFVVLGDFNRRLFARPDEPFWTEIDDSEPPEADLSSPGMGHGAECWGAKYPYFISHIVVGKSAALFVKPGSFTEHAYDAADRPNKGVISDHCPLSVVIRASPSAPAPRGTAGDMAGVPSASSGPAPTTTSSTSPIKGNINRKGKKIYHLPSCPDYARTEVTRPGERFFSSEEEAKGAGFQKAGNCPN
jgi:endonuclease/exonuclease/phosphatase family metal-dependent hydrolase